MIVLYILAYFTIAVFIIAIVSRAVRIASLPIHLRWELYPVAHEGKKTAYGGSYMEDINWWLKARKQNKLGELTVMLPEIFLLKGIWEHNRKLWLWSFGFHHGIYWLAGMAALMLLNIILGFFGLNDTGSNIFISSLAGIIGTIGYIIGAIGILGVIFMRLGDSGMRKYSSFATFFNLTFLLAIFVTGIIAILVNPEHFNGIAIFFNGIFSGGFDIIPAVTAFHIEIAILFVLYLPFSHMTHFFTKYFTYHSVRWNDEPNIRGGKLEKEIGKVLNYPVSWPAKHIGADGKKNWAEIAASEVPDDYKK